MRMPTKQPGQCIAQDNRLNNIASTQCDIIIDTHRLDGLINTAPPQAT